MWKVCPENWENGCYSYRKKIRQILSFTSYPKWWEINTFYIWIVFPESLSFPLEEKIKFTFWRLQQFQSISVAFRRLNRFSAGLLTQRSRVENLFETGIFSIVNRVPLHTGVNRFPLHTGFHYHLPVVLIWLKYCYKGHKITSHPWSIHPSVAFPDFTSIQNTGDWNSARNACKNTPNRLPHI